MVRWPLENTGLIVELVFCSWNQAKHILVFGEGRKSTHWDSKDIDDNHCWFPSIREFHIVVPACRDCYGKLPGFMVALLHHQFSISSTLLLMMFFIVKFMVFVSLQHCKGQSYNNEVLDVFLPAVHRILKHNMVSFTFLWSLIYKRHDFLVIMGGR